MNVWPAFGLHRIVEAVRAVQTERRAGGVLVDRGLHVGSRREVDAVTLGDRRLRHRGLFRRWLRRCGLRLDGLPRHDRSGREHLDALDGRMLLVVAERDAQPMVGLDHEGFHHAPVAAAGLGEDVVAPEHGRALDHDGELPRARREGLREGLGEVQAHLVGAGLDRQPPAHPWILVGVPSLALEHRGRRAVGDRRVGDVDDLLGAGRARVLGVHVRRGPRLRVARPPAGEVGSARIDAIAHHGPNRLRI